MIFGFIGLSRTKGGQRKGRGLAIAGLVLSLVWVLAIGAVVVVALVTQPQRDAGGEVTTGGNETFAGVQVGDCANNLTEGVDTGVDLVPCSQPHQGQVFAIYDLPDGPYPGEDAAFSAAQSGCLVRVPAALGDAPEAQDLRTFVYFPQAANWSAGDRQVICAALSPTPMTGSLPGLP